MSAGKIRQTTGSHANPVSDSQTTPITNATGAQTINQPEERLSQQQLLERHCGLEKLPEGKIEKEEKIGEGAGGLVSQGTLICKANEKKQIVIKELKDSHKNDDYYKRMIAHESRAADMIRTCGRAALYCTLNNVQAISNDGRALVSDVAYIANFALQQTNKEDIAYQPFIDGTNGDKAIYPPKDSSKEDNRIGIYKTPDGRPNDIAQAAHIAREGAAGLHSLGQLGITHNDLGLHNVKFTQDQSGNYHIKFFDLGFSRPIGTNHLKDEYDYCGGAEPLSAPEARIKISRQLKTISTTRDTFIYGRMLCEIYFGHFYNKWENAFDRTKTYSIYEQQQNPEQFLRNLLQEANQLGNGNTLYPPAFFKTMSDLIVRMCALDPNERPSSQYYFAVLNDIALCAEAIRDYEELKLKKDEDLSQNDTQLLAQLEPLVENFKTKKPMITGTTSQAMQLIHDLNELNQKPQLTQEEKETKEVLIYNLQRDFEISPENQELQDAFNNAIHHICKGEQIPMTITNTIKAQLENLSTEALPNKEMICALLKEIEKVSQLIALSELRNKLTTHKNTLAYDYITENIQNVQNGELLDQQTIEDLNIVINKALQQVETHQNSTTTQQS